MTNGKKIAVIGAGASGLFAAARAAEAGAAVTVYDRNRKAGVKLRITGKGRCNITNNCEIDEFLRNVVNNPKFLYAALHTLSPSDTMSLFAEQLGVPLKTERGRRVFPVSDNAHDVADALTQYAKSAGGQFVCARVRDISVSDGRVTGLVTDAGTELYDAVIIATGGISYPKTGSDGDGYRFAASCGHTIVEPKPSLVPVETVGDISSLSGLPLRNVTLTVRDDAKQSIVYEEMGELLFTHFGLSGPLILSASAHIQNLGKKAYTAYIDLKPALDEAALDKRLLSDFQKYANRDFINALSDLLPHVLIPYIIRESGIPGREKVHSLTKEQRKRLLTLLKALPFALKRFRPIDEAVVTAGGVSTKEINPKTMESKKMAGLYFAGELIDVDAYTGGYNLQIAFSTGALAGMSAATLSDAGREPILDTTD